MKKKILFWILGIIGVLIIGGGAYAYHVYSNVSNTLDAVHKPLDRDKSDKRSEKVDVSDKTYFNFNDGCRSTWRGSRAFGFFNVIYTKSHKNR